MALEIWCRVTANGLVPKYNSDYDAKAKLIIGTDVLCTVSNPRNYEFHKKFWALLRLTVENLPEIVQKMHNIHCAEDMLDALCLELGYYKTVWHGGKPLFQRKSISFAEMDNDAFEIFYDRCIDLILDKYLRGTDKQDLLDNIADFK